MIPSSDWKPILYHFFPFLAAQTEQMYASANAYWHAYKAIFSARTTPQLYSTHTPRRRQLPSDGACRHFPMVRHRARRSGSDPFPVLPRAKTGCRADGSDQPFDKAKVPLPFQFRESSHPVKLSWQWCCCYPSNWQILAPCQNARRPLRQQPESKARSSSPVAQFRTRLFLGRPSAAVPASIVRSILVILPLKASLYLPS